MERVSFRHRGLTETPVSGDQLPLSEATAGRELERQECRVSGAFEGEGLVSYVPYVTASAKCTAFDRDS